MNKELIIFFCETTRQGQQGKTVISNPSESDKQYAERQFKMWSNCYLVKIRETDENGMFSDTVLFKRNIEI